ncbi:MAG: hypothetical protein GX442_23630 [Candidatus Riflebacteria bacterium]|nr:hypothetical protein [Candidatus Riflebacteria bacterium]
MTALPESLPTGRQTRPKPKIRAIILTDRGLKIGDEAPEDLGRNEQVVVIRPGTWLPPRLALTTDHLKDSDKVIGGVGNLRIEEVQFDALGSWMFAITGTLEFSDHPMARQVESEVLRGNIGYCSAGFVIQEKHRVGPDRAETVLGGRFSGPKQLVTRFWLYECAVTYFPKDFSCKITIENPAETGGEQEETSNAVPPTQ